MPDIQINMKGDELSLQEKLDSMPQKPGVYRFINNEGKVMYVGKAQNLRSRVRQYFHKSRTSDPRIDVMVSKIHDVEITVTDTEVEALILEANLIKNIKPRYNVLLKDDKSYPYIVITDEQFPRVFVTRRKVNGKARYFGPYTDVRTMRSALKTVRDIFMIRSCNYDLTEESVAKHKFKLCLDYHIKKCEGPCEQLVSRDKYVKMINHVAQILRGKVRSVVNALEQEMESCASEMRFEDAAALRDKIRQLSVYSEKQKIVDDNEIDRDVFGLVVKENDGCGVVFRIREGKVVGSRHFYLSQIENKNESEIMEYLIEQYYLENEDYPDEIVLSMELSSDEILSNWLQVRSQHPIQINIPQKKDDQRLIDLVKANAQYWLDELQLQRIKRGDVVPHAVLSLQRDLRLSKPPRRIECFDISNTQGTDSVASMVVFVDGKPRKSEYRKYRIKTVEGPDDFASMEEVIDRRYSKMTSENEPNLIVLDGGKGQLSSGVSTLQRLDIHIPAIGLAKKLEEIFFPGKSEPLLLPKTSSSLRLLQQLRDEAHRFAVTYHRSVREKRILQTELDLIKGIGKKYAQELLEAFGSVQGVKFATEEQLADVVGEKLASRILEYFSKSDDSLVNET